MTSSQKMHEVLKGICESVVRIQDTLLDCAKDAIKSDETTAWQDAETLFQIAKEADGFRKRLVNMLNDNHETLKTEPKISLKRNRKQSRTTVHTEEGATKKKKSEYPKYMIVDNCLVKIGLQRDKRTEYQHIVQKAAFDKIISVVANRLTKTKDFMPDSIQTDLNLPAYQTYVVLSLLRQRNLLKIPRRGLYTATDAQNFLTDASVVWNKLSTSEGQIK